jgi:hypothetical protein
MTELYAEENRRLRAIDLVISEISDKKNRSLRMQIESAQYGMQREIEEFYEELIETAKVIRQSYV